MRAPTGRRRASTLTGRPWMSTIHEETEAEPEDANDRLSAEYGPAWVTANSVPEKTVYRWQDEDIQIKLKITESNDEIKRGTDYQTLFTQRNQARIEAVPPATFRHAPVKDQPAESAPRFKILPEVLSKRH